MSEQTPERIWAWKLNSPYSKYHHLEMWKPFFPIFKSPTVRVFQEKGIPWWKFWGIPYTDEPVAPDITEYIRADLYHKLFEEVEMLKKELGKS